MRRHAATIATRFAARSVGLEEKNRSRENHEEQSSVMIREACGSGERFVSGLYQGTAFSRADSENKAYPGFSRCCCAHSG